MSCNFFVASIIARQVHFRVCYTTQRFSCNLCCNGVTKLQDIARCNHALRVRRYPFPKRSDTSTIFNDTVTSPCTTQDSYCDVIARSLTTLLDGRKKKTKEKRKKKKNWSSYDTSASFLLDRKQWDNLSKKPSTSVNIVSDYTEYKDSIPAGVKRAILNSSKKINFSNTNTRFFNWCWIGRMRCFCEGTTYRSTFKI